MEEIQQEISSKCQAFHVMKKYKRRLGWEGAGVSLATPNIKDIKDHWVTE
jgi:hypothetical protein